jgi:hypothetical protein
MSNSTLLIITISSAVIVATMWMIKFISYKLLSKISEELKSHKEFEKIEKSLSLFVMLSKINTYFSFGLILCLLVLQSMILIKTY